MARDSNPDVIGLIAIIVGGLLIMGALMFLLVALIVSDLPRVILIPPVVQIVLGLLASTAGFFSRRGHATAKLILLFVAIGVIANVVFLAVIFVATIGSAAAGQSLPSRPGS